MSDYEHPIEDGRFPEELRVKAPRGACKAIDDAAERRHMSRSEFVRQALFRSLEADGVKLRRGHVEFAGDAA
jgi:metal-responsive CopG/Arc/MetJ family transcriptional regulator